MSAAFDPLTAVAVAAGAPDGVADLGPPPAAALTGAPVVAGLDPPGCGESKAGVMFALGAGPPDTGFWLPGAAFTGPVELGFSGAVAPVVTGALGAGPEGAGFGVVDAVFAAAP